MSKRRKAKGRGKGGEFERKIAKRLSLWWSEGDRDDLFWRTSQSGGRATQRSKKHQKTQGHYGDICATGSSGRTLTRLCTIELKTGYGTASIADFLDPLPHHHPPYAKFIEQAMTESEQAKTPFWMLIARRHSKDIVVCMPYGLYTGLKMSGADLPPHVGSYVVMRCWIGAKRVKLFVMPLTRFLKTRGILSAFHHLKSASIMKL